MSHKSVWPLARPGPGVREQITLSECTEARTDKFQEMAMDENAEHFITHVKKVRDNRWQHMSLTW